MLQSAQRRVGLRPRSLLVFSCIAVPATRFALYQRRARRDAYFDDARTRDHGTRAALLGRMRCGQILPRSVLSRAGGQTTHFTTVEPYLRSSR